MLGLDPRRDRAELRQRLGVQLQDSQLPDQLRVGEALRAVQLLLPEPGRLAASWSTSSGLTGKAGTRFGKLSGGQKQRLSIALALVGNPRIAILDELTTGLDPQARRDTWELIEGIRDRGVTVVLVTHFMEEAERLCDRVALIDAGRVVAHRHPGRPGRPGRSRAADPVPPVRAARRRAADRLPEVHQRHPHGAMSWWSPATATCCNAVTSVLARHQIIARQLRVEQASLEDAFVALTGRPRRQATERAQVRTMHAAIPPRLRGQARARWPAHAHRAEAVPARAGRARSAASASRCVLLIIFGSIPSFRKPIDGLGGLTVLDVYIPILIALVLAMLALSALPPVLASYRERASCAGWPPRRSGPAGCWPPSSSSTSAIAVVTVVAGAGGGRIALRRPAAAPVRRVRRSPRCWPPPRCSAIGLLIAAVAPTGRAGQRDRHDAVLPDDVLRRAVAADREPMPAVLQHISHATPLGAAVQALHDAAQRALAAPRCSW